MLPLERQLNLLTLLLETSRALTFEEIRQRMGVYDQDDRDSAKRQFERDKDLLRELGIPVDVETVDPLGGIEGYRVPKERYYLPEISFTPEEMAALFVAAGGGRDDDASLALRKLAVGSETGVLSSPPTGAVLGPDGPSVPTLRTAAQAVAERRLVRFRYRSVRGEEGDRRVDAWALALRRGAWYLVGHDRDREEARSFRLSRVVSDIEVLEPGVEPPEGFRPDDLLETGPWGIGQPGSVARVAFSPKVAWWALSGITEARTLRVREDGWTEAEVPAGEGDPFVSWILSFGSDATVLEPAPLRERVVETLERVRASL